MSDGPRRHPHLIIRGFTTTESFTAAKGGSSVEVPARDRASHAQSLLGQITSLKQSSSQMGAASAVSEAADGIGLQVEFGGFPDVELSFESLSRERSGIELLNVRQEGNTTHATVFVPSGRLAHFEKLIADYLALKTDSRGYSRDHQRLVDAIRDIRAATLRELWTDDPDVFPTDEDEPVWWEVWLPVATDRAVTNSTFRTRATLQGLEVASGELDFPERTVLLVRGTPAQLKQSVLTLNTIAELRRPKETAEFFDSLLPYEQPEWVEELLSRLNYAPDASHVPYVCLLDTGVNRSHPLLESGLDEKDLHSVEPAWGVSDAHGHGTSMAGLALLGNLTALLEGSSPLTVEHRLESVKLLREEGSNAGSPVFHGYLTAEAVARPEITAPARHRVFNMAVTARDARDRGRPSAWSSTVDRLASDADSFGESPRLIIVSAGNILDQQAWGESPISNDSDSIHDPAQAWNALTVGAYTELVDITEPDATGFTCVAMAGGLSPFSTTSVTWQPEWPLKPDVVFEGGNAAKDALSSVWLPSLSLLTTNARIEDRLFTSARATSAATALASGMAARLMAAYPSLWPETVRGLIVHSAEWTPCMRETFLPRHGGAAKSDYARLLRRCGFGVPDLERATWSLSNSLTMLVQEELQPFQKVAGKQPSSRDMHLHQLPWPKDALEELGETEVEMRVTLSYFVQPNPSARGVRSRYRYESHGLRFDVKRPAESVRQFRARVNAAGRDEEFGTASKDTDSSWVIGKQNRHRGSLHSDIWRGTAADLASRATLAVYPTMGWWRTRPFLERFDHSARYSLIVTLRAPSVDVDLYTEVENILAVPISIET